MITLSIVIVNYNVCGFLEQCLLSVGEAVKAIPHEIFVVDNASTDDSPQDIPARFPQVKYIYNTENVGFARANRPGHRAIDRTLCVAAQPRYGGGRNGPLRGLPLSRRTPRCRCARCEDARRRRPFSARVAAGVPLAMGLVLQDFRTGRSFSLDSPRFRTLSPALSRRERGKPRRCAVRSLHAPAARHARPLRPS